MHKISEALIKFDEVPVDRDAPKIREGVQSILRRYTLARTTPGSGQRSQSSAE
jgi:hypothetical protein